MNSNEENCERNLAIEGGGMMTGSKAGVAIAEAD